MGREAKLKASRDTKIGRQLISFIEQRFSSDRVRFLDRRHEAGLSQSCEQK